jgi:hypothetical protein
MAGRPGHRQHEAGDATSATEVYRNWRGDVGHRAKGETASDLCSNGAGPEEPQASGFGEDRNQSVFLQGAQHGAIKH